MTAWREQPDSDPLGIAVTAVAALLARQSYEIHFRLREGAPDESCPPPAPKQAQRDRLQHTGNGQAHNGSA